MERPPESSSDVRILCIGATGMSGSTLLTRMLGQLPGAVAVGEVGRLWDKGIRDNTSCGCGRDFHDCPFWTEVGRRAFGGWAALDHERALRLREVIDRQREHLSLPRAMPFLAAPRLSRRRAAAERAYLALLGRVYRAIHAVSGGDVIVDSMKEPPHVFTVSRLAGADVRVVHQIRDSRGVAFSGGRLVPRQGGEPGSFRRRSSPFDMGARWLWTNLSFELLARLGVPTVRVRYDELVEDPRGVVRRVARFAGVDVAEQDLAFLREDGVDLPPDHLVAGNRLRLGRGSFVLRADEEWREGLAPNERRLVSAITWPLMRRYQNG